MINWNKDGVIFKRLMQLVRAKGDDVPHKKVAEILSEEFGISCTENAVKGVLFRCRIDNTKKISDVDRMTAYKTNNKSTVFSWTEDRISFLKKAYGELGHYGSVAGQFYDMLGVKVSVDQIRRAVYKYMTTKEREEADLARFQIKKAGQMEAEMEEREEEVEIPIEEHISKDKEIMRVKAQRDLAARKYEALLKDQIFMEHIIEMVREVIVAMPRVTAPTLPKSSKGKPKLAEKAVLMLSDAHVGEVVDIEQTRGIAEYNFDIFRRRMEYLGDRVIDLLKNKLKGYDFEEIHIAMLGDIISGNIHEELQTTNEYTAIESVHGAAIIVSQFLMDIARQFPKVVVPCVIGNHGRMVGKPQAKNRYVNWDYVFYNMVDALLQNQPNIQMIIPKSFYLIHKIFDFNVLMMHGDYGINGGFAGIPFYGVQRASFRLNELLSKEEELLDLIMMGHFHSLTTLDRVHGGSILMNGSIIGGTEYSVGKMFTSNQPKQMLLGIHPEKGKTWSYDINLSFAPVSGPCRYKYNNKSTLVSQWSGIVEEFPL